MVFLPFPSDSRHHLEKAETTHHEDEALLNVIRPDYECPAPPPPMEPLYALTEDGKVQGKPLKAAFSAAAVEASLMLVHLLVLLRNS